MYASSDLQKYMLQHVVAIYFDYLLCLLVVDEAMERIVTAVGNFEVEGCIRQNMNVTFLATDATLTVGSSLKHLSMIYGELQNGKLKEQIELVEGLLRGELTFIRRQIGERGYTGNCGELIEAVNMFGEVLRVTHRIYGRRVVQQAFRLAGRIVLEMRIVPIGFLSELNGVLETVVRKGIYSKEWLQPIVQEMEEGF